MSRQGPTLTICSMVNSPPARLAVTLDSVDFPDKEIVLAVDDRVDPSWIEGYRALADRVLVVPFPGALNPLYGWLVDQCSGHWIYYIEADEVASPYLGAELREAIARDDVTHCLSPRRWLYPDDEWWIAQWPWRPDYQRRLIRNQTAVLRFPSQLHEYVSVIGAKRYLREPLYHASLVQMDLADRERKVEKFEAERPGMVMEGRPFNELFYLPERRSNLKIAPVPAEAKRTMAEFFAADQMPLAAPGPGRAEVSVHTTEEITLKREGSILFGDAYKGSLTLLDDDLRMVINEGRTFDFEVSNLGGAYWAGGETNPAIRVGCRWVTPQGGYIESSRTQLPAPLGSGESQIVPVLVVGPPEAGSHILEVDLLHEGVCWFGCGVRLEMEVRRPGDD